MGVLAARSQELSARNDAGHGGSWGTVQIATPIIVCSVLIIIFATYIIWQRRQPNERTYDYHSVKNSWASRIEKLLVPRRRRHRVLHGNDPVTLDDSIPSAGPRIGQQRSGSSESLTSPTYGFNYPPRPVLLSSSPPPERFSWKWWKIFGRGPQEIRSHEPSSQWCVDEASAAGHGSHCHEPRTPRCVSDLPDVDEDREEPEVEDNVIRIGGSFTNLSTPTPKAQQFPEGERMVRVFSPAPELVSNSLSGHTPAAPTSNTRSARASPVPSTNPDLPRSSTASQDCLGSLSLENLVRLPGPPRPAPLVLLPPPVYAAGYGTPHTFHGRHLSSDSMLATQVPMTTLSMY